MTLFGHPIGRKMEDWWKKHGLEASDDEWLKWVQTYGSLITHKLTELSEEHENAIDGNKVFGMSTLGGCVRKASLKFMGYKGRPLTGSEKTTFFNGHSIEVMTLSTLEAIGYSVEYQASVVLENEHNGKLIPVCQSKSDGLTRILGTPTVVSVKSTAYKMSGKRQGKWIRNGFAELPFKGVRGSNPSAYIQLQAEMLAGGFKQGLILYVAKDIVKAFENDDYLGAKGNGSLTFYAEMIYPEPEVIEPVVREFTNALVLAKEGKAYPALYPHSSTYKYVELNKAEYIPSNIWGGKNKELTGSFNPCGGCELLEACRSV